MAFLDRLAHFWHTALRRLGKAQTVGVRVAAFNRDGQILLVKHTYLSGWMLPGGAINPGEGPLTAAKRELFEETGIALPDNTALFGVYHSIQRGLDDYVALYVSRHVDGNPCVNDPVEIQDTGWFDLNALPAATTQKTKTRLDEIERGHPTGDQW